jgi:hypothetical protein
MGRARAQAAPSSPSNDSSNDLKMRRPQLRVLKESRSVHMCKMLIRIAFIINNLGDDGDRTGTLEIDTSTHPSSIH